MRGFSFKVTKLKHRYNVFKSNIFKKKLKKTFFRFNLIVQTLKKLNNYYYAI